MTILTAKQRNKMCPSVLTDDNECDDSSQDDSFHGKTKSDKGKTKTNNHSTDEGKPRNRRTGSCISNRNGAVVTDIDGDERLEDYLLQLSDRKGTSSREKALSAIVQAMNMDVKVQFVEKNYAMLLYQCLLSITKGKGSAKELLLASRAIGLLGMIVEDEDYVHKIFQDSIPVFLKALESDSKKFKILDSLATVTFFGASNVQETEKIMQIIWKYLKADCNLNDQVFTGVKHSAGILSAAISAWSFLLSTIEGWRISHQQWQGAISYMLGLLEEGDDCVYIAAAEALALMFETDCIEKFTTDLAKDSTDDKKHSFKQELKDKITEKLRFHSLKAGKDGRKQEAISDVLKFFEAGETLETYAEIGEDGLVLSTWCQKVQLNYIRSFLGEVGLVKHLKQNEILQSVFEFTPRGKNSEVNDIIYSPDREKMTVRFYQKTDRSMLPFVSKGEKQLLKKMTLSSNSFLNKARTRLLNKKRMLSQGNHSDDYASQVHA